MSKQTELRKSLIALIKVAARREIPLAEKQAKEVAEKQAKDAQDGQQAKGQGDGQKGQPKVILILRIVYSSPHFLGSFIMILLSWVVAY